MSDSAKIGRGKRSPARARYKLELREQRNRRLRAEKLKKHPQIEHPKKGITRALRRHQKFGRIPADVLVRNGIV